MSKSTKHRSCPAAGRTLTAAECGSGRITRFACPPECPFNPFAPAHYDQFSAIEDEVGRIVSERLIREVDASPERQSIRSRLARAANSREFDLEMMRLIHGDQDAEGLTFMDRWEREGFPGQKNDALVVLRGRVQHRIALMEILCVRDHQTTEVADLLAPGQPRFLVVDRGLARTATRFTPCLAPCYPLPHYSRLLGFAIPLPAIDFLPPDQIFLELIRHLGAPEDAEGRQTWLMRNLQRIHSALRATALVRQRAMWQQSDTAWYCAEFALNRPFDACRIALDSHPNVEPDDLSTNEMDQGFTEARVWFDDSRPADAVPGLGRLVLGRVLLGSGNWRLQAMGDLRGSSLRSAFEKLLGRRVTLQVESRESLASRRPIEAIPDEDLVPPRLLQGPRKVEIGSYRVSLGVPGRSVEDQQAETHLHYHRAFIEKPVPALDGKSAREAASDLLLRPVLIRLVKERIRHHDERNLKTGRSDDINWLPRELGLHEIIFDPPPVRPPLESPDETSDDDLGDEEDWEMRATPEPDPTLPPPPRLPPEPLSTEEASERLHAAAHYFKTAEEAFAALEDSGSTVMDDAAELTEGIFRDKEFAALIPTLIHLWFALVPPGHAAPPVEFENWAAEFALENQEINKLISQRQPDALLAHFTRGPQPNLSQFLCIAVMTQEETLPKALRPRPEVQPTMIALLRSLIVVLDECLRSPQ